MLTRKPEDDLGVKYFTSSKDNELRQTIRDGKVKYTILQEYDDAKVCWRVEQQLIAFYWKFFGEDMSYNHSYINCKGEKVFSTAGIYPSEETRKKMSNSRKGEKNGMYGKHHSEESINKIKLNRKGKGCGERNSMYNKSIFDYMSDEEIEEWKKKNSESHKGLLVGEKHPMFGTHKTEEQKKTQSEKVSGENNGMYGKHHSEESRIKMSNSRKGRPSTFKGKKHSEEAKQKNREAHLGKKLKKYYWKTPDDKIVVMAKTPVTRYHSDWTLIGPVK
jgi:hypothetical protein